jgi:hypothetical protein
MPGPPVQPFTFSVGPVTASPEAPVALSAPIGYDYDPVYLDTYERTLAKVGELFETAGDVVLMQGEALLGLEAAARGLRTSAGYSAAGGALGLLELLVGPLDGVVELLQRRARCGLTSFFSALAARSLYEFQRIGGVRWP